MKQKFHLEPPQGLMNDPNGLCEFQKKFHVFFQWNPREKNHSYKCWGHFVTEDFLHWKFLGKAIEPSENFDQNGTYSGSACVVGKKICLFYTGNDKSSGARKVTQCLAESFDGKNFKNLQILGESKNFEMIECPDLINFGEKKFLLYGLQKRDNERDEVIFAESFYKNFTDGDLDKCKKIDTGFDFYAPQTFSTSDGRKILFAWMSRLSDAQEKFLADREKNIHCLTMPREIFLKDDKIYQKPVREMYKMIGEKIFDKEIPRTFYCKVEKNFEKSFYMNIGDELKIIWSEKIFKFLRKDFSGLWEEKNIEVEKLFEIEIWSDESSVEIFLNGGEFVMSARTFFEKNFEIICDEKLEIFTIKAENFIEEEI